MNTTISTKQLLSSLTSIIASVKQGARFTFLHRGHVAFRILPVDDDTVPLPPLAEDTLFGAPAVGRSTGPRRRSDHDTELYGRRRGTTPPTSRR